MHTCQVRLSGFRDRCATWISSPYKCRRITMIYGLVICYALSVYTRTSAYSPMSVYITRILVRLIHSWIIVCSVCVCIKLSTVIHWCGWGDIREERLVRDLLKGKGYNDMCVDYFSRMKSNSLTFLVDRSILSDGKSKSRICGGH